MRSVYRGQCTHRSPPHHILQWGLSTEVTVQTGHLHTIYYSEVCLQRSLYKQVTSTPYITVRSVYRGHCTHRSPPHHILQWGLSTEVTVLTGHLHTMRSVYRGQCTHRSPPHHILQWGLSTEVTVHTGHLHTIYYSEVCLQRSLYSQVTSTITVRSVCHCTHRSPPHQRSVYRGHCTHRSPPHHILQWGLSTEVIVLTGHLHNYSEVCVSLYTQVTSTPEVCLQRSLYTQVTSIILY